MPSGVLYGAALAAACMNAASAQAQYGGGYPTLPPTIANTRVGDLRGQLQQYLPSVQPRATGPKFLVTPGIGVDVGVTDNAERIARPRQADIFTIISPNLLVSGDTARLKVNLNYAPLATLYAQTPSQTRFDQFGNLAALATIVDERLFLDVRGSVSQQSRTGGFGQDSTQALNRDDQIQTVAFSVNPYSQHSFGGWGKGRLSYTYAQTLQNGRSGQNGFDNNQNFAQDNFFGATGNLTTHRERASFTSGENLGRFRDTLSIEAVQYDGVGSYRGAYRNQAMNDVEYAFTRTIAGLVGFGYQDLKFSGVPGVRISEPTWSVGARFNPTPDTSLAVSYGRRDGFDGAQADGAISPTARTRVFVRYSSGLTTDAEEQQNLLASSSVGPTGLLTDSVTGAPVSSSSGAFGTQNGLFRLRRFSVSGQLLLNRDAVSLGLVNEERQNVNTLPASAGEATVPAGASTKGTSVTLAWQHELSPTLSGSASLSYGVNDNGSAIGAGSGASQRTIQSSLGLTYVFTQTLSGSARYLFTDRSGGLNASTPNQANFRQFGFGQAGTNFTENALVVGLRKSF